LLTKICHSSPFLIRGTKADGKLF